LITGERKVGDEKGKKVMTWVTTIRKKKHVRNMQTMMRWDEQCHDTGRGVMDERSPPSVCNTTGTMVMISGDTLEMWRRSAVVKMRLKCTKSIGDDRQVYRCV
jgi:hypothetical protein